MHPRSRRRSTLAFALLWLAVVLPRAGAAPVPPADRVTLTPSTPSTTYYVEATFAPPPGETCVAKHRKPIRARYRGSLDVLRTADGKLAVIDGLTFPQYLSGVAEVPRSWPAEALKAQVVAARSYALYQYAHPRGQGKFLGYNICATDQCQVFRGVAVEQGPFGENWVAAIRATTGEALVRDGAAVQAFYFSTSSGRTKSNEEIFGGRPLPYLRPVSGEDGDAPLATWTATLPLVDVTAALVLGKRWDGGTITSVVLNGEKVKVSAGGTSATMAASTFRNVLNDEAPCVAPSRYPGPAPKGRKLPLTLPGREYSLKVAGGSVNFAGRGWGHGVGMSQFGARSLAARGRTYRQILAHFYGGMTPRKVAEPGAIRVLAIDGAETIKIRVEGTAAVRGGTGSTFGGVKELTFTGGETLGVQRGFGTALAPVLEVKVTTPPPAAMASGVTAEIAYDLSAPARVALVFMRGGAEVSRKPEVSQERGPNSMTITAADLFGDPPDGAAPAAVVIEAYDGIDRVRTDAMTVGFVSPTPTPTASARAGGSATRREDLGWAPAVAGAALLAIAAALLFARRRRSRRADQPNVNV